MTQHFTAARVKIRDRQNNGLSIACKQAIHLGIARSEGSHTNFKGSEVHGQPIHVTYDCLPHDFPVMSLRQLGLILALKYWDSLSWLLSSQQKMLFYVTGPLLKGLSEYKIQKKISFDHFNRFLQNCGSNLVCLRLSCCQYVDNDVIKHLGQYCPNLEGLSSRTISRNQKHASFSVDHTSFCVHTIIWDLCWLLFWRD